MKKLMAAVLGGAMLLMVIPPVTAAETPDEWWTPSASPQGEGWRSLFLSDGSTLNREPSRIYARSFSQDGTRNPTFHCATVDSPKCVELNHITAHDLMANMSSHSFYLSVAEKGTNSTATQPGSLGSVNTGIP